MRALASSQHPHPASAWGYDASILLPRTIVNRMRARGRSALQRASQAWPIWPLACTNLPWSSCAQQERTRSASRRPKPSSRQALVSLGLQEADREVAAQPAVTFSSAALAARMQAPARLSTRNALQSGGMLWQLPAHMGLLRPRSTGVPLTPLIFRAALALPLAAPGVCCQPGGRRPAVAARQGRRGGARLPGVRGPGRVEGRGYNHSLSAAFPRHIGPARPAGGLCWPPVAHQHAASDAAACRLPVLLMDLKGPAYNAQTINSTAAAAKAGKFPKAC